MKPIALVASLMLLQAATAHAQSHGPDSVDKTKYPVTTTNPKLNPDGTYTLTTNPDGTATLKGTIGTPILGPVPTHVYVTITYPTGPADVFRYPVTQNPTTKKYEISVPPGGWPRPTQTGPGTITFQPAILNPTRTDLGPAQGPTNVIVATP